jgi:predicted dehydrogenase
MPIVRSGGVEAPQLDASEPLRVECAHFIECIQHGRAPLTGGEQALAVIRVLDAAQRSITSGGMTQALDGERPLATGILANLTPRRVHLPP